MIDCRASGSIVTPTRRRMGTSTSQLLIRRVRAPALQYECAVTTTYS